MKISDWLPAAPWSSPLPIPQGLANKITGKTSSFSDFSEALKGDGTVEQKFTRVVNALAPQVPNFDGLPAMRDKINSVLAPQLLNKWLPPLPKALNISWPGVKMKA